LQSFPLQTEVSEIIVDEADEPNALVGLFDSDGLAGEHLAEVDVACLEADAAAAGNDDFAIMEGVGDFGRARGRT
jgi:hypothetical protein